MDHPRPNPEIAPGLRIKTLTLVLGWACLSWPVAAHQLKVTDSVGGTLHLEPNDTPKAQSSTLIWIALTHPGGALIPLEECKCSLTIYSPPRPDPIAKPPLRPIATAHYQGIPGTEFTFPVVGTYTLVFQGTPRRDGSFKTFELSYPVTVAAGPSPQPLTKPESGSQMQPSSTPPFNPEAGSTRGIGWVLAGLVLVGVGLLGMGWLRRLRQ